MFEGIFEMIWCLHLKTLYNVQTAPLKVSEIDQGLWISETLEQCNMVPK